MVPVIVATGESVPAQKSGIEAVATSKAITVTSCVLELGQVPSVVYSTV